MDALPISIMVADDDVDSLRTLEEALMFNGFNVTGFADPRQALAHHDPGGFDAAILDYKMPEMNGIELLQELKKLKPNLVVVIVTGQLDDRIQAEAMKCGATDFFYKPIDFGRLMAVLNRVKGGGNQEPNGG